MNQKNNDVAKNAEKVMTMNGKQVQLYT